MSRPVVIDVADVSLAYKLYNKPSDMLWESVLGKSRHDTFWALKNVSLQVHEGQRVGLIGPNGAGKSSLLQIIAGNVRPSGGSVDVNGKISSLLSLSPVWNAEDTGIENVKFNLMVQGAKAKDIPRLTEEIIDFTELGSAMLRPVKTFSSGMSARLAFGIATALDPEILIIDEVLGAGDAYFAGKAMRRMEEFCNRGKALLFVSHATSAIRQFCDRAVWLENGAVRLSSDVDDVLTQYEADFRKAEDEATRAGNRRDLTRAAAVFAGVDDLSWVQFRIMSGSADHFIDAHYIHSIKVDGLVLLPVRVDLNTPERISSDTTSALDLFGSEWGRLYEWRGLETRLLAHAGGRAPGGRFRVQATADPIANQLPFQVEIVSASRSEGDGEPLALEYFDIQRARWTRCAMLSATPAPNGMTQRRFTGVFERPESDRLQEVLQNLERSNLKPVEIESVRLLIDGRDTTLVKEREPFTIDVVVNFRAMQPRADIGIKFIRSDGVYAYWQSSGLSGANLINVQGERTVSFHFDPNQFGAGEYIATVYAADGWDFPANYPYSRVLDRKVSALQFTIEPEFNGVDFGVANLRVAVDVR